MRYQPKDIETKWQKVWEETELYAADDEGDKKLYASPMLPYPSGAGLHVGHVRNYSIADAVVRFYRQRGHNVMSTIGWDAFGLPAENYAIKTGTPPAVSTNENIDNFRKQLKRLGISYDWSREVNTSDPDYYKWTQWVFLQLFKEDKAYQGESLQWWCPEDNSVLANEQVVNGKCWRHEDVDVERRWMKQWFFKITDYAEDLLEGLEDLDWPKNIKTMQENWIGKSIGAEVIFKTESDDDIKVFTTRPDTLFGATFMVLAPEHPLVEKLTTKEEKKSVKEYVDKAEKAGNVERMDEKREKTGVFTGSYAINPVNDEKIPIWIADYVLMDYGTGAIMAVPAHDERDNIFAKKYDLPIVNVVDPRTGSPQENPEPKGKIVAIIENEVGELLTNNWGPKLGGRLFVGGTIDGDEKPLDTAKREIAEETGYVDIELIEHADETVHHEYFSFSKKKAWLAETGIFHFKLKSDKQEEVKREANETFEVEWVSRDVARNEVSDELHKRVFNRFIDDIPFSGEGVVSNSGQYNGLESSEMREKVVADLAKKKLATEKVNYKIHDWLISRQRYWGAPIPIIHCEDCGAVPVPEDQLPVELPEVKDYAPTGENTSVLAGVEEWVNVSCPKCDGKAKRETDTMDGYACSSWYLHRYTDPHNDKMAWDPKLLNSWFPLDFYFGGDHAVSHLLYVRFWNRFFVDQGLVSEENIEPIKRLVFNGYINAEDGAKMSKSKDNVVDPLDIIDSGYGADALRLFELFIGPYEQDVSWNTNGVPGTYRFLQKVWNLSEEYLAIKKFETEPANQTENETLLLQSLNRTIKKVTDDLDRLSFNTAIASLMEFMNSAIKIKEELPLDCKGDVWRESLEKFLQILAPFAPHITEELWERLGHTKSIHRDNWPVWDEDLVKSDLITIVVQVNGKVRANLEMPADVSEEDMEKAAKEDEKIASYLTEGDLVKTITVPGKLVSFVVKN